MSYHTIFKVIDFIDKHNLSANLFRKKLGVSRKYDINSQPLNLDSWTLSGTANIHERTYAYNRISLDINLGISQSDIQQPNFDLMTSKVGEIIQLKDILDNPNTTIQTLQKQGDIYVINNYSIRQSMDKIETLHSSKAEIEQGLYDQSYAFDKSKNGFTNLIIDVELPMTFFKDIECHLETEPGDTVLYYGNKLHKKTDLGNYLMDSNSAFYSAVHLKAYAEIMQNRSGLSLSDDIYDRLSFTYAKSNRRGYSSSTFNDIKYEANIDPTALKLDAFIYPKFSEESNKNYFNVADRFSYDFLLATDQSTIITIPDVFDPLLEPEKITSRINTFGNGNLSQVEINILIPQDKIDSKEKAESILRHNYDRRITELKVKWNNVIKIYDRIYNGKKIDRNMFALLFIQKYFVPNATSSYYLLDTLKDNLNPLMNFFEDNFMPFEEFFGTNYLTKYIDGIVKYPLDIYTWRNDRLENEGPLLFRIGNNRTNGNVYNSGIIWPSEQFRSLIKENKYQRKRSVLIINDSGTKTAWKDKTRRFVHEINRRPDVGTIGIMDVNDKFQLLVLKRIISEYSNIILYSDFSDKIQKKKKIIKEKPSEDIITFYTPESYSNSSRQITPSKTMISNVDPDSAIFIEFSSTKRTVTYKGKSYSEKEFDYLKWAKIFAEHQNRELIQVSKNVLNKLINVYNDRLYTLDRAIDEPQFTKNFERLSDNYLFVSPGGPPNHERRRVTEYVINELYTPFRDEKNISFSVAAIQGLILNSFTDIELRAMFSQIIKMVTIKDTLSSKRYINLYNIVNESILIIPPVSSLNYILYKQSTPHPKINEINAGFKKMIPFIKDNSESSYNSYGFELSSMLKKNSILLRQSNYLNINNREHIFKENVLMLSYLDQWDTKIRVIEKKGQEA